MSKQTFQERKEAAEQATHEMHQVIAQQLVDGAAWLDWLRFSRRFHRYSMGNIMLMWAQWEQRKQWRLIARAIEVGFFGAPVTPTLPDLSQCAGGSDWIKMGGHIVKDEKALSVLAPFTVIDRDADPDPVTGKQPTKVIGFVLKNRTFDISQIDGVDAPPNANDMPLEGTSPDGMWDALVRLAAELGCTVAVRPTGDDSHGFYDPMTEEIVIDPAFSDLHRTKTLAHEVAHKLLHGKACPVGMNRATKEIEAESVAFSVMAAAGIESDSYSFEYVGGWSQGNGALMAATLERVATTTARIVTFIEDGKLPDHKEAKFYRATEKVEAEEAA